MMNRSMKSRFRPDFEALDQRDLPAVASGVTATLVGRVLVVSGTNPLTPIRIDLMGRPIRGTVVGSVTVAGAGRFQAAQVSAIAIVKAPGERVIVRHKGRWSPYTTVTVRPLPRPTLPNPNTTVPRQSPPSYPYTPTPWPTGSTNPIPTPTP